VTQRWRCAIITYAVELAWITGHLREVVAHVGGGLRATTLIGLAVQPQAWPAALARAFAGQRCCCRVRLSAAQLRPARRRRGQSTQACRSAPAARPLAL
jgi:hypothetical protein